ncbi:glycoside hydrolase family 38 C-terminal domain-containing protein, partial [Paenibacillus xylanexedens]|uniref:glycoside hydrolase family 38 C-terminal domain-containing protein n=1 Tax=Paenibacillus xylanexedens TaxID=528191 RepID=UPI0034D95DAC
MHKNLLHTRTTKHLLHFHSNLHQSQITQHILFYHHSPPIHFHTHLNSNQHHNLLKLRFPIHLVTSKPTFQIPFPPLQPPTH